MILLYSIFYYFLIVYFVAYTLYLIQHFLAILRSFFHFSRPVKPVDPEIDYPGVTIIKPLIGADGNLYNNLCSFFELKYPKYELLLCIEDDMDPAKKVCNILLEKFPKVDAKLCIGGDNISLNGKVSNINRGYIVAKYGLIYISDASIIAQPDQLTDLVNQMDDDVGYVCQVPFMASVTHPSFGRILNKIYFGTMHLKLIINTYYNVGLLYNGMNVLIRKSIIDTYGLEHFGETIAEDNFLSKAVLEQGYKQKLGNLCALQNPHNQTVGAFQTRMIRWAIIRQHMTPILIVLETIGEMIPNGILGAVAYNALFGVDIFIWLALHCLVWFIMDYCLLMAANREPLEFNRFDYFLAWAFREITSAPLLIRAATDSCVTWRNKKYHLSYFGARICRVTNVVTRRSGSLPSAAYLTA